MGITVLALVVVFAAYLIFAFKSINKRTFILDLVILSFCYIGLFFCCLFLMQGWLGGSSGLSEMGVGVGILIGIMLLMLSNTKGVILSKCFRILGIILIYQLIIFSSKFGNLLLAQEQYERSTFELLNEELDMRKIEYISVEPGRLYVPIVLLKSKEYPIWKDLISFNLNNDTFFVYMNSLLNAQIRPCSNDIQKGNTELLSETIYWRLTRINSQCIRLELKQ